MSPIFVSAPVSDSDEFVPAPAGAHAAVCCDVADIGEKENKQGRVVDRIRVYFQLAVPMEDGRPYIATRQYTKSLHEKASLRQDLEAWRGRAFTPEELQKFDVEKLIGAAAMVTVVHKPKTDGSGFWANIASVSPLPEVMEAPIVSPDYVRWQDRTVARPAAPLPNAGTAEGMGDPDVPF